MFNLSGSEIVFLLLIALIVLGPEKLPDAVRKFGKVYAEFKKMSTGFQSELKSALDEPMREMRETADAFKKAANFDFDADARLPMSPNPRTPNPRSPKPRSPNPRSTEPDEHRPRSTEPEVDRTEVADEPTTAVADRPARSTLASTGPTDSAALAADSEVVEAVEETAAE